jgi:hypothetical protein
VKEREMEFQNHFSLNPRLYDYLFGKVIGGEIRITVSFF